MPDTVISVGGNISDLQAKLKTAERDVTGLQSRLARQKGTGAADVLGEVKGFLGGVVGITALKGLVDEFDRLGDLSNRLGLTAEELQRLNKQASQSGTDLEAVVGALTKLRRNIEAGGDNKTAAALDEIGINAAQLLSLAPDQQIALLAEAFQNAQARGIGFAAMQDLMGKGFAELIPLLRTSRAELEELAKGPVVSEAAIARLQAVNDGLDDMATTAKTFGADMLDTLGTRLQAVIQSTLQGGTVGDNLQKIQAEGNAAAEAKRKQAEEQKKLDAAAAETGRKQAAQAEAEKIQLDNERKKAALAFDSLTTAEKLAEVQTRIAGVNTRAQGLQSKDDPVAAAKLQGELIDLLTQETALKARAADESKRNAEEAARAADAAERETKATQARTQAQVEAQRNLGDELAILKARSQGREREAQELERQARIKADANRITKETGIAPQDARKLAEERDRLQTRAEARDKGKILGGISRGPLTLEQNLETLKRRSIEAQTPALDDFALASKRDATGKLIKPIGTRDQGKQTAQQGQAAARTREDTARAAESTRTTEELLRALVKNTTSLADLD